MGKNNPRQQEYSWKQARDEYLELPDEYPEPEPEILYRPENEK